MYFGMGIWGKFDGNVYYCKVCILDSCLVIKHLLNPKEMQARVSMES